MPKPQEKLAIALESLRDLQARGVVAIRSADLSRTDREVLSKHGFIRDVMKGWYIASRPDEPPGETTSWYSSYWAFCSQYLAHRFGDEWSLSPEQSVALHSGNLTVPQQLQVRSPKAGNVVTSLPHGTSLFEFRSARPAGADIESLDGLRIYSRPAALIQGTVGLFAHHPTDTRAVLASVRDASEVLGKLLEGGHSTIAGRLAGAFRNIGREEIASEILETMTSAGFKVIEADPFDARPETALPRREASPVAARIRLMWAAMRKDIPGRFPPASGLRDDADAYLGRVQELYVRDAYHSLSIEGYRVSPDLIERVRSGHWNPNADAGDRQHKDALAARGYWQAFQAVQKSLESVLKGENPGLVAERQHSTWYRELFGPSVTAGILSATDLAGYRNAPVCIRRSMYVPPSREAVRDAMPVLFELLAAEPDPAARAVLGHFFFVHIHPYLDGNGRMGRFLMNVMLASGGYPWTVIPVERRADYMAALEEASVGRNIAPFADFLAELVRSSNS